MSPRMEVPVPRLLVGATSVAALAVGLAGGWLLARPRQSPRADAVAQGAECASGPCTKFGREGECIQGYCVLGLGACSMDIDCDDGTPCTADRCESGTCASAPVDAACNLSPGRPGVCENGTCEALRAACTQDEDCARPANTCVSVACVDGRCARTAAPPAAPCKSATGAPGACADARCMADLDREPEVKCTSVYDPWAGRVPRCTGGLRFRLPADQVAKAEADLARGIADVVRYDMRAALVGLPQGGYNVVLYNKRDRTVVRGLCDPSFVAYQVAGYTAGSSWKSQNMHVWLAPYREGWGLMTSGSREAVMEGRSKSLLGALGVVEISAFRTWLEKTFYPLRPEGAAPAVAAPARLPEPAPGAKLGAAEAEK